MRLGSAQPSWGRRGSGLEALVEVAKVDRRGVLWFEDGGSALPGSFEAIGRLV